MRERNIRFKNPTEMGLVAGATTTLECAIDRTRPAQWARRWSDEGTARADLSGGKHDDFAGGSNAVPHRAQRAENRVNHIRENFGGSDEDARSFCGANEKSIDASALSIN